MVENKEFMAIRIDKNLKDRFKNLVKKRDTTSTSLLNQAIKNFLKNNEYDFNDLLKLINEVQTLKVHYGLIKKEIQGCPNNLCAEIIEVIQDKEAFFFEESFEGIENKINSLEDKERLYGIFLHFFVKDTDVNELNKMVSNTLKLLKDIKVNFYVGLKKSNKDKIFMFVGYNKKEGEND